MGCNQRAKRQVVVLLIVATTLVFGAPPVTVAVENQEDLVGLISRVETAVWNRGDVDRLDEIYDPACILHMSSSMQFEGTAAFKAMVGMFHVEIPDRKFKIDEIFATSDRVVERYTWTGTHSRSGTPLSITGCVVYHIKDGKISEAWNFEDIFSLYQQLGLVSEQSPFSNAPPD